MAYEELAVTSDDSRNPFSALIATESEFEWGEVRVEPPFIPGSSYLEGLTAESDVTLELKLTTSQATLLRFGVNQGGLQEALHSNKERVEYTVNSLLQDLGKTANAGLVRAQFVE